MSANYPTSLDNTTTIPAESSTVPLSTNHVSTHANIQAAIIALETKLGADSSAVNTTVDFKLSGVATGDKAVSKTGTETLTNKTLTSPVMSNPTLNITSGATGDTYYNGGSGLLARLAAGTNGYIMKMVGGLPAWAAETVITNASTTAAGIVEEATQAEVDAGTATGGTGARLFINPSTLSVSSSRTNYTAAESITSGDALAAYYYQANGAITLDAHATNNTSISSAGGTITISFTTGSNSNRMMVVFINIGAPSGTVPTPTATYNGVSLTARDTQFSVSQNKLFSFSLASPASGTNNLVLTIPASGQTNYVSTGIKTYYNVAGIDLVSGAAAATVSYGTPALCGLITSACGANTGSSSVNNNSNYQSGGLNSFSVITTADSGISYTSSSATVTFMSSPFQITTIGLTPSSSITYGVVKASAATPANGVNLNKYSTFVGFAAAAASAGSAVKTITNGEVTSTSLTPLVTYYLSDTAGAVSTSSGTNSKKVGLATSTTSLLLKDTI